MLVLALRLICACVKACFYCKACKVSCASACVKACFYCKACKVTLICLCSHAFDVMQVHFHTYFRTNAFNGKYDIASFHILK
jgi:hypothetical protein